jgi:hypothetical protein
MAQRFFNSRITGRAAVLALLLCAAASSPASETHTFANGITATIHTPEDVAERFLSADKSGDVLVHPAAGSVALASPAGAAYPFETAYVVDALAGMHGFETRVDVEIFILDRVPTEAGGSFARRGAIYLAPGTGPVPAEVVAYITVHEMGHVLTWARFDEYPGRWDSYLQLRGVDAVAEPALVAHADRPREILAEDIRFLFGGALANSNHSIENHDLAIPSQVDGLADLLAGYLAEETPAQALRAAAFPNPCNPRTTIELVLPADASISAGAAEVRIFDLRGALVRTISGGHLANGRLNVIWDGTTDAGTGAASGRYAFVVRAGRLNATGAVTLVR